VVIFCLLLYVVFAWLGSYTHHGEKLPLPDLSHMSIVEAKKVLEDNGLQYTIEDSVYMENFMPGMVVSQIPGPFIVNPKTGEKESYMVKENRRVYLTINKLRPPMVSMPSLIHDSKRIAVRKLSNLGMNIVLEYKSNNTCGGCVLEQIYNGRRLKEGERIERGSIVTVVLGKMSNKTVGVPNIIGLKLINARTKLINYSINLGRISGDCTGCKTQYDTLNAFVVKQNPSSTKTIYEGAAVNIQISRDEPNTP
jgi:beta-lactam-binding protein with PASTA domain